MNLNDLAIDIAKNEGLKKQVKIGDIKEILKIICLQLYSEPELLTKVLMNGQKQATKNCKRGSK